MDADDPAILCIPFPSDEPIPFQVIDYEGHIAPTLQHLLADLTGRHRTEVIQRFQDRKL
jgi:hypothetical protein